MADRHIGLIARQRWRARRWFWNRLGIFKYDHNRPTPVPVPVPDRPIALVPLASRYRGIPIQRALVADRIPADERRRAKRAFSRVQVALYRLWPAQQRGLPPVDADPVVALDVAYTAAHRRRFPGPTRPTALGKAPQPDPTGSVRHDESLQGSEPKGSKGEERESEAPNGQGRGGDGPDLGALAVASPFACYVSACGGGAFTWDLRALDEFEYRPGLRSLGSVVSFEAESTGRRLVAVRIDCDAGSCTPSDPEWPLARRLALASASTHLSLVRHFGWIHLAAGGPLAVVTRNELPPDHPLRRLLWPHVYATQYSNDMITVDQLSSGGDFEGTFSFTARGVSSLLDGTIGRFDLGVIDPDVDARRRGLGDLTTPSLDNRRQHHAVFLSHASRYLGRYYDDDEIAADPAVVSWWIEVTRRVPGVEKVAGRDVTLGGVARLAAAIMQLASVEHEIAGSGVWDYQLWSDVLPARVGDDGTRPPLDVYQRLVNANFNLNVHRTALLEDFSYLAIDAAGAGAFRTFRNDLLALQAELDTTPSEPWRMEPRRLKANINA